MSSHLPQPLAAGSPREPGTVRHTTRAPVLPPQPDAHAVVVHPCREDGTGYREAIHFDHHEGVPFRESEHLARALLLATAMFLPALLLLAIGIAYALVFVR